MLRAGLIALAFVVALIAWVATQGDDSGDEAEPAAQSPPRIVSAEELAEIAAGLGHPVYWMGQVSGRVLEVTESSDGSVTLRYQEEGLEAGEGTPAVLTVGSYPISDPAAAFDTISARPGAIVRESSEGRAVVTNEGNPTSVYFADPGNSVQVEVYDPSPKRAMALALSALVRPIG